MSKFDILVEKLMGGLADNKTVQDIAKKYKVSDAVIEKQIAVGMSVEKEHTNDKEIQRQIAMDHLFELGPTYYTELAKMEKQIEK